MAWQKNDKKFMIERKHDTNITTVQLYCLKLCAISLISSNPGSQAARSLSNCMFSLFVVDVGSYPTLFNLAGHRES